jgi:LmbE family N-acetylglucosaminyl deacetylase
MPNPVNKEDLNTLFIAPHADDEALFAGLTLASLAPVTIAFLTDSGGKPNNLIPKAVRQQHSNQRRKEAETSSNIINAQTHYLEFPDGNGIATTFFEPESLTALASQAQLLLSLGPDGIYGHIDHFTSFYMAYREAVRKCLTPYGTATLAENKNHKEIYHTIFPQHLLAHLVCYYPFAYVLDEYMLTQRYSDDPVLFVKPNPELLDKKQKMLSAHASQHHLIQDVWEERGLNQLHEYWLIQLCRGNIHKIIQDLRASNAAFPFVPLEDFIQTLLSQEPEEKQIVSVLGIRPANCYKRL